MAKPAVITAFSSDIVIFSMKGLMTRGASVWPTKMLPAAERVSAPDVRIVRCMIHAIPRTTNSITPR